MANGPVTVGDGAVGKSRFALAGFLLLATVYALFASAATVYAFPPNLSIDGSWTLAVQRIATDFAIFSSGYVFTYGQLMPLQYPLPGLELYGFAFFFTISGYSAYRILQIFGPLPVAALLIGFALGKSFDALLLNTFVACFAIAFRRRLDPILIVSVALLCHVKYSMIMVALGALVLTDLWIWLIRKEGKPANTAIFSAAFVTVYLIFGGLPSNLGNFIGDLGSIIFSYNEAMAVYYVPAMSIVAYCLMGWLAIALVVLFTDQGGAWKKLMSDQTLALILVALALFVAVKSGYTRADAHILAAWNTAIILFFLLAALAFWLAQSHSRSSFIVASTALCTCIAAPFAAPATSYFTNNAPAISVEQGFLRKLAGSVLNPEIRANAKAARTALTAEAQTRLTEAGLIDTRIDAYPTQIGDLALAAPNYTHRPVIQTYSSYDSRLQQADLKHLQKKAPDVLLIYPITDIDDRMPGQLLGPSYMSILSNYQKSCSEYRHPQTEEVADVWRRRDAPVDLALEYRPKQATTMGDWIDIPPELRTGFRRPAAKIEVQASTAGRIIGLLLKPSRLLIDLEFEDGSTRSHRFIGKAAEAGFPILSSGTERLTGHISGTGPQVVRFRLREEADYLSYYAASLQYTLGSYALPEDGGVAMAEQCLGARLRSATNPPYIELTNSRTIFAHAAATVLLDVRPNERIRLTALMPEDAFPCSDGVRFQAIENTSDGVSRLVWETSITGPSTASGPIDFFYSVPANGATLSLKTEPIIEAACDWSTWRADWE